MLLLTIESLGKKINPKIHIKFRNMHVCIKLHYYRMDLLSRAETAFSPDYRAGTTIPGLKVEPSVPGHRAGTKEGPLVPVGGWCYQPGLKALQPSKPGRTL